jgi:hypothetical protein
MRRYEWRRVGIGRHPQADYDYAQRCDCDRCQRGAEGRRRVYALWLRRAKTCGVRVVSIDEFDAYWCSDESSRCRRSDCRECRDDYALEVQDRVEATLAAVEPE